METSENKEKMKVLYGVNHEEQMELLKRKKELMEYRKLWRKNFFGWVFSTLLAIGMVAYLYFYIRSQWFGLPPPDPPVVSMIMDLVRDLASGN